MKTPKPKKPDTRPRFGWCKDVDENPQHCWEDNLKKEDGNPVVLIPLPFMSPTLKKQVREFTKSLWPK